MNDYTDSPVVKFNDICALCPVKLAIRLTTIVVAWTKQLSVGVANGNFRPSPALFLTKRRISSKLWDQFIEKNLTGYRISYPIL